MVGGFLGAGKTTALLRLAERLTRQGLRVGLITNDQGVGLVDTALVSSRGFPVAEIGGGCFCCRFTSLVEAAERLTESARPDVFLAEPVGSCTDLAATVSYPLRRMYGDAFAIAPYSVMLDPERALRILGVEPGRSFSPKVRYVYEKQLEEAELVVVNKIDAIDADRVAALAAALADRVPDAELHCVSARSGAGVDRWFERVMSAAPPPRAAMDVDYDVYADGEARLGWFNCTARMAGGPVDGNALLRDVAVAIQAALRDAGVEVAHLKMMLSADDGGGIAVVNLTRSEGTPELSHALAGPAAGGELVLNLRAEGDPELLRATGLAVLERHATAAGAAIGIVHAEHFRPGRPVPTYRLTGV
jgi:Ni2+-binding GTPase involved in maturation of urease and hydrogenase